MKCNNRLTEMQEFIINFYIVFLKMHKRTEFVVTFLLSCVYITGRFTIYHIDALSANEKRFNLINVDPNQRCSVLHPYPIKYLTPCCHEKVVSIAKNQFAFSC